MEGLRHASQAVDLDCTPLIEARLPKGSWPKATLVPLGDLACSQTAGGSGVAWSLIGAYILAGEIVTLREKDNSSWTAAMVQGARYHEEILKPIATSNHGGSERFESLILPRSN